MNKNLKKNIELLASIEIQLMQLAKESKATFTIEIAKKDIWDLYNNLPTQRGAFYKPYESGPDKGYYYFIWMIIGRPKLQIIVRTEDQPCILNQPIDSDILAMRKHPDEGII